MAYRIAGVDVHKKMLAVVIADVEGEGEYQFERRKVSTTPGHLRALAAWLVERDVEEVVMESTAQYWRPVWEALERYCSRFGSTGRAPGRGRARCTWHRPSRIAALAGGRGISPMPNDW